MSHGGDTPRYGYDMELEGRYQVGGAMAWESRSCSVQCGLAYVQCVCLVLYRGLEHVHGKVDLATCMWIFINGQEWLTWGLDQLEFSSFSRCHVVFAHLARRTMQFRIILIGRASLMGGV